MQPNNQPHNQKGNMPKGAKPSVNKLILLPQFLQRVKELWETHEHEFMQVLDESETKKINLTFKANLDMSETAAKLQTSISFSQVVKDAREDTFDDENQLKLPVPEEEEAPRVQSGKPETKGKGGKKGRATSGDFVPPTAEPQGAD